MKVGEWEKQPCHLPEETGVQLVCAASSDIWCEKKAYPQAKRGCIFVMVGHVMISCYMSW